MLKSNDEILLIGRLWINLSEILIEIYTFSLKKNNLKNRLQNGVYFASASMS